MSEHTDLVAHLRGFTPCGCNGCWNSMQLAADAIEALGRQYEVRGEILAAAIERAEKAERERDEALETSLVHLARAEEAEKHEAIAVADNAALLEELVRLDAWDDYGPDHPGAALLSRMERLEAVEFEARQARASGYRTSACQRIDAALDACSGVSGAMTLNAGHEGYTT